MAERIVDNADLAVTELKRKARRRLVGAIVLALAAAVILPLLLEKEQKPLGDDVSVQIPPVDEGKFINRLTGRSADFKPGAKFGSKSEVKPEVPKVEAKPIAAPASDAGSASAAKSETHTSPGPTTSTTVAPTAGTVEPPRKSLAEAEQHVLSPSTPTPAKSEAMPTPAPKSDANPAMPAAAAPTPAAVSTTTRSSPAPAAASAKPEGFAVQIAAFTDDKGANALAAKLKKAGYASSYTEPVETSHGTMWRVRVGGFASRAEADAARAKLKADGWNGLVVAAQ
jgi:DedD protein